MKECTLCFLVNEHSLSLGIKKQKLGKGKLNGFGGNVETGETRLEAAKRELYEEARVKAVELEKVAEMHYTFPDENKNWNQIVHVYLVKKWEGEPQETEEMTFGWFPLINIPYEKMWENDKQWIPEILKGKKLKGYVFHTEEKLSSIKIEYVDSFQDNI